jgi:hypothetical protein
MGYNLFAVEDSGTSLEDMNYRHKLENFLSKGFQDCMPECTLTQDWYW